MKTFSCHCGNTLHFGNTLCLNCGRNLGFLPEHGVLSALEAADGGKWRALAPVAANAVYRMCFNYKNEQVCNWMIADTDDGNFCYACSFNHIIPDLTDDRNRVLWRRIEHAKRRLFFTLMELKLPIIGRKDDPERGLTFAFLADHDLHEDFVEDLNHAKRVMTGHDTGLITINIAEADHIVREDMRLKMSERYRTVLGHFRHEIGHFYWDRLIRDSSWLENFRLLFGDERQDYEAMLKKYYEQGPPPDWTERYISAYASAHPWEDWGETWAHYLHIYDTVETAHDFGFAIEGQELESPPAPKKEAAQYAATPYADLASFDRLLYDWGRLTVAMNALNRSMGLRDAYPFALSPKVSEKLRFVHSVIVSNSR